ncbi:flagellar basal body-associated FliL family protein [Thiomicrorhabdus indica]|uniref:flagellar basal body-associated FliL family protein n=1 Tax=Thiomicrorhabdus indica TaxID=2267253 RepID=UPI00102D8F16|nr:flagellar basal body-associated FliL family protein [Thiomicrorhabdus indica]
MKQTARRALHRAIIATSLMTPIALMGHSTAALAEDSEPMSYSPKYKQFEPPAEKVPKYFAMDKNVVNFNGEGQAKFLAVDFKFMSYYPQLVEVEMEHLRPILKNNIDRVLRNQSFSKLNTPDGPDELRKEILKEAKAILEEHRLFPDLLEDVYLERFVMQ